ncbi:MAG: sulfatase-like hydrolase/transferase [Verrucomicrobiales bacterium]|nr:sulfatase-like hydrolase/transferase [Verrucomicrobiales bacterium]
MKINLLHILFAALLTAFPLLSASQAQDLPNILWITSEDNGPQLGCYGDKYAITPHLDELAAKGMRYTRASSNAPVCAPARTTIISGIYPPSTGSEHMRSMTRLPEDFKMYPAYLRAAGYYCTNNNKEDYNVEKNGEVWDESGKKAHWKNRPEGKPFFAIFNSTISHESKIRNKIDAKDRIHDPAKAPIPAYHPDTAITRKDWAQYYDRMTQMDGISGRDLKQIHEAGLDDNTIIFYYGDHGSGMPRSKRWPYFSGLNVPFIVYFPKKWQHLAPADYQAGGSSDRRISFIDLAPTLLSLANIKPMSWMQGNAFSGKYQTEEQPYSFGFRGRMDERYDLVRTVVGKDYIYIRNYMPHRIYGQHIDYMFQTPTTQQWHDLYQAGKLNKAQSAFWETKPAEELYDLKQDPDEVNNLAQSSEHQEVLKKMRSAQQSWLREIKDVGFLPEAEVHSRSKDSSPYQMGHDASKYNFDDVYAAANLASSLKIEDLPAIIHLLDDKDSAVRYWGIIGLLCHQQKGLEAGHKALLKALKDPSASVQILAAEALGRYGSDEDASQALDVILSHCNVETGDLYEAILAANALDYLGKRALPKLDEIKALPLKPKEAPKRLSGYVSRLIPEIISHLEKK